MFCLITRSFMIFLSASTQAAKSKTAETQIALSWIGPLRSSENMGRDRERERVLSF